MSWDTGNQKPLDREDINKKILDLDGYLEDNKAKYYLYKILKRQCHIHNRVVDWG